MDLPMPHKLTLSEGSRLTVTAVTEVVSFDENEAILHTPLGPLIVQGEHMQLKTLSSEGGQTAIEGTVTALYYDQSKKGGFLSRLFK